MLPAPCPDQQALCVCGEKLEEGLKGITVRGKCGGEVIDVRKEGKRQENIPRVALGMDKLIVCSVRQAGFLILVLCLFL